MIFTTSRLERMEIIYTFFFCRTQSAAAASAAAGLYCVRLIRIPRNGGKIKFSGKNRYFLPSPSSKA